MNKATRNTIERATQQARKLLEENFASLLEGTFDVLRSGVIASKGGAHLSAHQHSQRNKIVAAVAHKRAAGMTSGDAVTDYVRDAAFTTLNRFVALKMLEVRELVQECITKGEQSAGYREFCGMAPGVALLPDAAGYRLYIESLFDEFSTEIRVLFDRRDAASALWPKRPTFDALLAILNSPDLSGVWDEDETIGWVYQFFNSGEERKKMREESQAPRNSRELAVRNQFFTPRYVVQFLTDNTLGRLWLEMHGDRTRLKTICEYIVRVADEPVRSRPRKDPRDLRILDPACGSGHFLLYSFDLLLAIYEEAWSVGGAAQSSQATSRTLRDDYPELIDLRHAMPRLIVEQNLYGVDIDPRCAQIAALALWLRAQRAWKELGIAAFERPHIHRTHIVVAEPIPGDMVLVDEFAARLDPPLLRDLFKHMVAESRLAGDLGALLRIEDAIVGELRNAREQFVKQSQTAGFLPGMEPVPRQLILDLSGIDDDSFFHEAEAHIIEALRRFAETAINGASVRRRLFAGDAAQGIALVDLVRTRFDVLLMNPPFGACSLAAKKEFEKCYPRTKNDVYAAFVERGIQLLHTNGLLGAITSRSGFFLSSFQKWREEILLKEAPPVVFADLGYGVLDSAMVEVAIYCLEKASRGRGMKTIFLRALEADDKAVALRAAIQESDVTERGLRFEVDPASFSLVPRSPFAYWATNRTLELFRELAPFESAQRAARHGAATLNNDRFLRLAWEVNCARIGTKWLPYAKGGAYSPFYDDVHLLVNWYANGAELKQYVSDVRESNGWGPHWTAVLNGYDYYLRPGLTWPSRTQSGFAPRVLPKGCLFDCKGNAAFFEGDCCDQILGYLAVFLSDSFRALVSMQMAFGSYDVGVVQRTPVPELSPDRFREIAAITRRAFFLKRELDTVTDNSHAFALPALLQGTGERLAARADAWAERAALIEREIAAIQAEINGHGLDLYGIDKDDLGAITQEFGAEADEPIDTQTKHNTKTDADTDSGEGGKADCNTDAASLAAELAAWSVGVAFGRFDVCLANGESTISAGLDPFHQLPTCSPAMLTSDNGLPLTSAPSGYPIIFPENGVLVDDPGHARDLSAAVRAVFDEVFKASADAWWSEVATLLDPKEHNLSSWLASNFFEHHLKRYSKSRRKAPILWQLAVPSGRYSVWLYAHRLTRDSFFQIQNDVVTPKLAHEERQLNRLIQGAGPSPSAKERKEIAEQEALVEELGSMLNDVKRVAPLWNPMLDDGVVLTMAPLWHLVPQHRPWQKELKSKWDELASGKYDWAHVAMHLWPERVVPRCATDRSLAIAHGLEEVFWVEGEDGKWRPRTTPTRPVEELVRERTSSAVKVALKNLLAAPVASAKSDRGSARRVANAAADGGAH